MLKHRLLLLAALFLGLSMEGNCGGGGPGPNDEVELYFRTPAGAVVHESWRKLATVAEFYAAKRAHYNMTRSQSGPLPGFGMMGPQHTSLSAANFGGPYSGVLGEYPAGNEHNPFILEPKH